MSAPDSVQIASEPKSSIEAALGASSTPKGEPATATKLYFHFDGTEQCLRDVEQQVQGSFERMRKWATAQRASL